MSSAALRTPTLLILDGSFGEGCVAQLLLDGEAAGRFKSAPELRPHQPLVARAAALLPDTAARSELVAVLVGVGPGSYTGLRAAASLAAGVAAALNIPVMQVPSDRALLLARDASGQTDPVILPLGVREVLLVDAAGVGSPNGAAPQRGLTWNASLHTSQPRSPAPPPKQLIFCAHTGGARSLVPRRMRLRSGIPRHHVVQSVESLNETCRLFNASHDA